MEIKNIAIVGCGTMGSGIAQVCAQAGYKVNILEKNSEFLNKGLEKIRSFMSKGVEKGKITKEIMNLTLEHIKGITEIENLSICDLAIEACTENLDLKKDIFIKMDKILPKNSILATNTSCLSIIDIASKTNRKDKVLGLHFMNPAPIMKLVEIVRSIATSNETIEIAKEFIRSLGKTAIIAKDTPGFIVNYLQYPFRLNAIRMLEGGFASKEDIDIAATLGLGHPMGPLALQDLVGLDITYAAAKDIYEETKDPNFAPPVLMKKMIAAGWLGRKTGKGFYNYKKNN
jgi:3-hydroxybutyryl-CoA dehydrogenase